MIAAAATRGIAKAKRIEEEEDARPEMKPEIHFPAGKTELAAAA